MADLKALLNRKVRSAFDMLERSNLTKTVTISTRVYTYDKATGAVTNTEETIDAVAVFETYKAIEVDNEHVKFGDIKALIPSSDDLEDIPENSTLIEGTDIYSIVQPINRDPSDSIFIVQLRKVVPASTT